MFAFFGVGFTASDCVSTMLAPADQAVLLRSSARSRFKRSAPRLPVPALRPVLCGVDGPQQHELAADHCALHRCLWWLSAH